MIGKTGAFRRSDRLLDSRDFRRVLRQGRRQAVRELVVFTVPRSSARAGSPGLEGADAEDAKERTSRLGLTVSRKVGNAVVRNRFKRRVRTWFRRKRGDFPQSVDLVVIARPAAADLSFEELDERLSTLLGIPDDPSRRD